MASRREILGDALQRWHTEGSIDTATYERLRASAQAEPEDALETAALGHAPVTTRSFAGETTQFVGGLLLGASLVALVVFLEFEDEAARWVMLALGSAAIAGAIVLHLRAREKHGSLVEAAFAVGFVPLGVAAVGGFGSGTSAVSVIAAGIAVGVHILKRGQGPTMLLCAAAVSLASFSATTALFEGVSAARAGSWLLALLAYLGLTLVWRRESWSSAVAGVLVVPLTIAFVMLISAQVANAESLLFEAALAVFFGALLALGVAMGIRGLVATAAAGLTLDAVVFAFDVGGALTAVFVLLALGGLLVWQGQGIRAYFKRGAKREGL